MEDKEVQALIQLLDDPNYEIFSAVKSQLLAKGLDIIPILESTWEDDTSDLIQERIEEIIHELQFEKTVKLLKQWVQQENKSILEGAYIIAHYQYPDINLDDIKAQTEKLKSDTWLEINENLTALEKVKIINHIVYSAHKFTRNSADLFNPLNYYINEVLSIKKGSSILLGIIYLHIAEQLQLPIHGVDLPKNFILAYKDEFADLFPTQIYDNDGILFYINPFNKGSVFGKKEIEHFLKQHKIEEKKEYYLPAKPERIIQRLVAELMYAYEQKGNKSKQEDLMIFLEILNNK
ncbi:MAG: hypothetical protein C0594_11990 [Marinilabiliales bacterium]|nr:MAG: hypothetical protein C0594_11990 [Marinilabiliales bacterium]